ncbi:NADP(H)-dependent aldo-keto reductase [Phaeodactylibacter sp.]|uniref:NADP(H)-dependent aldo-keto reductase n=1 Tax=Phaeodactylibacter sp. TaxID=1940289 RepID=UPI0025D68803|nr:NADP(H)-dependent aldo-keto reductase [Phaeodactylibacter sp.]MCI4651480.1 NADP(H)-dependent aldo-keto reductase [Phaeodactylibacter sp.]MCI5093188.1 NADP(H)-dependent aldo-keto reductase [Phaeodactylibacter sp.]
MKYSELGRTGLKVSKICLGTMTFGEQNTEAEGHEQLSYAVEQGVNFIDTAEMYSVPGRPETQGSTERIIGTWLKGRGRRDDVIIATKVTGPSTGLKHIRNPLRFTPEQIRTAIEGSLNRLQTDYVDLYQLHWPERNTNCFGKRGYKHNPDEGWEDNLPQVLQTLNELKEEGKIRHYGVSNETPWGLMRYHHLAEVHNLPRMVSIQNPYSLLNRTFEVGLSEVAMREQTGLLAYSPMAFGLLSGKYHRKQDQPRDRINKFKQLSRYNSQNCQEATTRYLSIAENYGLNMAQMSLAFVNQQPFTTANIIGATTMEQLRENISSIDVTLSQDVLNEIEAVHEAIPNPAP